MLTTKSIGDTAEKIAERYLQKQGLKTIERNFRCRSGEIDLIMQDKDTLVFVEVRYRSNANFGGPLSSIDKKKCTRLVATVQTYLQKYPRLQNTHQRLDVIGISGKDKKDYSIEWLKNAIEEY